MDKLNRCCRVQRRKTLHRKWAHLHTGMSHTCKRHVFGAHRATPLDTYGKATTGLVQGRPPSRSSTTTARVTLRVTIQRGGTEEEPGVSAASYKRSSSSARAQTVSLDMLELRTKEEFSSVSNRPRYGSSTSAPPSFGPNELAWHTMLPQHTKPQTT